MEYQKLLKELEQHLVEARKMERVAREREERAIQRETEGRKWEAAARAREQGLVAQVVAERERRIQWEGRAAEAQERERRISRNLAETGEGKGVGNEDGGGGGKGGNMAEPDVGGL